MNSKLKIIIRILTVGVISICGWQVLSNQLSESSLSRKIYKKGEPITFSINAKVKLWTNELPFKIVNEKGKDVKLKHSCIGFIGSGIDQYCEDGKIVEKVIYQLCNFSKKWCYGCSDAIFQREEYVNEAFVWDQKEYVRITEKCGDKIIHREVKKQVPEGKYQIIVNGKVIKEFVIGSKHESWKQQPNEIQVENTTKTLCRPMFCVTYYCDKNLKYCDKENAFGILVRPPSPDCIGKTIYKIKGKTVSKKEFYTRIDEKNKECGNCIIPLPQPCR